MRNIIHAGAAIALLLVSAIADHSLLADLASSAMAQTEDHASHGNKVLYWQHPDGKPDYSATPKKTDDERDFVPIYEEATKEITSNTSAAKAKPSGNRKILYYRNPMGLPDTSPTPKKDSMGMDYIPVYEGEDEAGSGVVVSLDRVQRSGVRTEEAHKRTLVRPIRAPAIAKPDERSLHVVSLRADAFVEKLFVNETGKQVKKGEPLFRIYSPQMVTAQINYQVAARDRSGQGTAGAEQQLQNLQVPLDVLSRLRSTGEPVMSIDWPSPTTGVALEKRIVEGQMARMGDELFRFADLSTIWVIADVSEQDLAAVSIGMPARIRFTALPNEDFQGKVTFMLHELDPSTRTGKVRIEVTNRDHRIKHEMYAEADIDAGAGDAERVAIPLSSVIDSGNRQVILVARGEGRFEPRPVKLGIKGEGYVEVLEGISEGESVVVSANFLIDAESNLRAALSSFTNETNNASVPTEDPK
jgi:Cu(I)/Ag(I) efflux system membrane fusion protein